MGEKRYLDDDALAVLEKWRSRVRDPDLGKEPTDSYLVVLLNTKIRELEAQLREGRRMRVG